MALANQLKFITKLKKGQLRNFDEDKGTLSGSVHQAIMDNNYHRLVMLIDAGIGIKVGIELIYSLIVSYCKHLLT